MKENVHAADDQEILIFSEFDMEAYDSMDSSLDNYASIAVQFGFATLFVTACPLAPVGAAIASFVEMRGDAYKLLHVHQR